MGGFEVFHLKRLLIALQLLTIIPVRKSMTVTEADIAKSSSVFVLVGLIQGIILITTDYLAGRVFHPDLVTGIILLVYVLSNGGFHLDGLADTFDAIAAKSESDKEIDRQKRLAVMKDSSTGPIGVITIFFALFLKYLSLNNLSHFPTFTYYSSILLFPMISKWAIVISMFYGKPAREDGIGRLFIKRIGFKEVIISTFVLLLLLLLPQLFLSSFMLNRQNVFYAFLLGTIFCFCRACVVYFNRKFGGLTGDTLGAVSEITEIVFLLMVNAWSRLSI